MLVLATIPSISVLVVISRSSSSGFIHGVFTTIGIVLGDIIFILLAIFGLSVLAETMGSLFVFIKYIGATYLIWLGLALWRSKSETIEVDQLAETSLLSSFLTGLFITLSDQKAILFYLGLLPAFVDLSTLTNLDTVIIITIAILTVGGVKLCYAFIASRTKLYLSDVAKKRIDIVAGGILVIIGMFLMTNS